MICIASGLKFYYSFKESSFDFGDYLFYVSLITPFLSCPSSLYSWDLVCSSLSDFFFLIYFYWCILDLGFSGGAIGKELTCHCRRHKKRRGLNPCIGRSPGEGNGYPPQYSCLENPIDRRAWRATVHRIAKSQPGLKRLSMHAYLIYNVVLVSGVQKNESIIHIHIATLV